MNTICRLGLRLKFALLFLFFCSSGLAPHITDAEPKLARPSGQRSECDVRAKLPVQVSDAIPSNLAVISHARLNPDGKDPEIIVAIAVGPVTNAKSFCLGPTDVEPAFSTQVVFVWRKNENGWKEIGKNGQMLSSGQLGRYPTDVFIVGTTVVIKQSYSTSRTHGSDAMYFAYSATDDRLILVRRTESHIEYPYAGGLTESPEDELRRAKAEAKGLQIGLFDGSEVDFDYATRKAKWTRYRYACIPKSTIVPMAISAPDFRDISDMSLFGIPESREIEAQLVRNPGGCP